MEHHGVVLAQRQVASKSNEIPSFRRLLDTLDLQDAVLTIERVYLITSLSVFDATCAELATWIRGHWGIESSCATCATARSARTTPRSAPAPCPGDGLLAHLTISVFRQDGQTNIAAAVRHAGRDCHRLLRAPGLT